MSRVEGLSFRSKPDLFQRHEQAQTNAFYPFIGKKEEKGIKGRIQKKTQENYSQSKLLFEKQVSIWQSVYLRLQYYIIFVKIQESESDEEKAAIMQEYELTQQTFQTIFDVDTHNMLVSRGKLLHSETLVEQCSRVCFIFLIVLFIIKHTKNDYYRYVKIFDFFLLNSLKSLFKLAVHVGLPLYMIKYSYFPRAKYHN